MKLTKYQFNFFILSKSHCAYKQNTHSDPYLNKHNKGNNITQLEQKKDKIRRLMNNQTVTS